MSPLFVPMFLLELILPFAVGIGWVLWARRTASDQHPVGLVILPTAVIIVSFLLSLLAFLSTGGGFGPGTGLFCLSMPAALITLAFALVLRKSVAPNRKLWYLAVACLVVPISLAAVPILSIVPINRCNELDRAAATPLISALESYRSTHGTYPNNLAELIPEYVAMIPIGPCHPPLDTFYSFMFEAQHTAPDYYLCKLQNHLLLGITNASGGFYQGYDLDSKEWSGYDNIDQGCSLP